MNEQLQQRANEILLSILNKATDIGSAALDEIPLVVQELLHWKFAESVVHNLAALLCFIITTALFRHGYKNQWDEPHHVLIPLVSTVTLAPIIGFNANMDFLQIWIAPRVYLLEYAATLIK